MFFQLFFNSPPSSVYPCRPLVHIGGGGGQNCPKFCPRGLYTPPLGVHKRSLQEWWNVIEIGIQRFVYFDYRLRTTALMSAFGIIHLQSKPHPDLVENVFRLKHHLHQVSYVTNAQCIHTLFYTNIFGFYKVGHRQKWW